MGGVFRLDDLLRQEDEPFKLDDLLGKSPPKLERPALRPAARDVTALQVQDFPVPEIRPLPEPGGLKKFVGAAVSTARVRGFLDQRPVQTPERQRKRIAERAELGTLTLEEGDLEGDTATELGEMLGSVVDPMILLPFIAGEKLAFRGIELLAKKGVKVADKFVRLATAGKTASPVIDRAIANAVRAVGTAGTGAVAAEAVSKGAREGELPTPGEAATAFAVGTIAIPPIAAGIGAFGGLLARLRFSKSTALIAPREIIEAAETARGSGGLPPEAEIGHARRILGLGENPTDTEIGVAFRRRAAQFHEAGPTPDEELFKVVSEAAAILRREAKTPRPEPRGLPAAPEVELFRLEELLERKPSEKPPQASDRPPPRTMQEFEAELGRDLRAVEQPPLINRRPEVSAADRERLNLPPEPTLGEEIAGPALLLKGDRVIVGHPGEIHGDLYLRLSEAEKKLIVDESGFATNRGRYVTREEAREIAERASQLSARVLRMPRPAGFTEEQPLPLHATNLTVFDESVPSRAPRVRGRVQGPPPGRENLTLQDVGPEPEPAPEIASLKKAEGAEIRERLGLEELEPVVRESFQAAWDEAKGRNLAEQATDVAQEAAASKRPLTPTEHAGAVQRYLELERDLTEVRSTLADAVRDGNDKITQQLSVRSERILDEIDALTEATDRTGSEAGRALSIRRLRANVETFTLASGLQMARSRKGGSLAPQEVNKIEELTGRVSSLEEQNTKLRTENDELEQKRLKVIAERVVRVEAKRKPRGAAARLQERQVVLQQLNDLGLRLNDISGVSAEGLFLIGKLAVNTIRETVARTGERVELNRIVEQVLAELNNPEIRPRDIHEALNARDPKRKRQQAGEAAQQVRRLKTHARLITQVEDAEVGLFAPSRKRPIAPAEIRQLQKRLTDLRNSAYRAGLRPERLERAIATLNELQDQLTNHFRNIKRGQPVEVTPELEAIQAKIRGLRQEMRVEDLLADLNEQLRTGDFKTPKRLVAPHISPQLERNQIALKRAQRKWRDAIERMAPLTLHRAIGETTGFLRTMKATADMSATMRQAFWLSARRPIKATQVFGRSVIAFFSEFTADQIDNAIRQHPNQLLRDRAKLVLTERGGKLSDREEMFTSNLAEQLPVFGAVVRASNQSMTTTLNLMRVAAFDQFLELYPNATTDELRAWANWVNVASGRGDLGRLAVVANEMAIVFFAPRFAVSRIQTPFMIFKFWRLPRVRKEIAKDYAAVVALGLTALGLAAAAGLRVGLDPRDSDFGKIRIGNTRIDIWGGVQQPVRVLVRIFLGLTDRFGLTGKELTESEKEVNPLELLGRFTAFKIAPSVSIPLELYRGKTAVGEETTPSETAIRSILPIIFEDVHEAYRDGLSRAALAGGSAFLGLGVSTFGDDKTVRGGPRAPRRPQPPRLPIRR